MNWFPALFAINAMLCLPLAGQDKAGVKEAAGTSAAAVSEWSWTVPSAATLERYAKLSEGAKAKVQSEAAAAEGKAEYNALFEKAFRAAVLEDEARGLSSGGVPETVFIRQALVAGARPTQGPSAEGRRLYESLSDAGKEKLRALVRENRERLAAMSPQERQAFMEDAIKQAAASSQAK